MNTTGGQANKHPWHCWCSRTASRGVTSAQRTSRRASFFARAASLSPSLGSGSGGSNSGSGGRLAEPPEASSPLGMPGGGTGGGCEKRSAGGSCRSGGQRRCCQRRDGLPQAKPTCTSAGAVPKACKLQGAARVMPASPAAAAPPAARAGLAAEASPSLPVQTCQRGRAAVAAAGAAAARLLPPPRQSCCTAAAARRTAPGSGPAVHTKRAAAGQQTGPRSACVQPQPQTLPRLLLPHLPAVWRSSGRHRPVRGTMAGWQRPPQQVWWASPAGPLAAGPPAGPLAAGPPAVAPAAAPAAALPAAAPAKTAAVQAGQQAEAAGRTCRHGPSQSPWAGP